MKIYRANDFFVFGYFGLVTNQLDGQTVKTRSLHQLFEENLDGRVPFYDTEQLKKNTFSLIPALFRLVRAKHLIYLPAQNNLRYFYPVLFFLSKIFHFEIHYFVIGGWLPNYIEQHNSIRKKLKNIASIFVETNKMLSDLSEKGFKNVFWFPNFRKDTLKPNNREGEKMLKLVFMSRVMPLKGVNHIFKMLGQLNSYNTAIYNNIHLDFFGPIDPFYLDEFEKSVAGHENVEYKGVLLPQDITLTLSEYDLLLFPTIYPGEGCPGAIIDSYFSGLPVIATDWKYNKEFVHHNKNGLLISTDNVPRRLLHALSIIGENPKLLEDMKKNAAFKSSKFTSEAAWKIIEDSI